MDSSRTIHYSIHNTCCPRDTTTVLRDMERRLRLPPTSVVNQMRCCVSLRHTSVFVRCTYIRLDNSVPCLHNRLPELNIFVYSYHIISHQNADCWRLLCKQANKLMMFQNSNIMLSIRNCEIFFILDRSALTTQFKCRLQR
jgi:hypothetical protein